MRGIPDGAQWIADRFGPAVIKQAESVRINEGPTVTELAAGWFQHVEKLRADLPLGDDDRTVWGAHDLVAAAALRGRLELALAEVGGELGREVSAAVAEVDRAFWEFTEDDESEMLVRLDGRQDETLGWWWRRIPTAGPARRELDKWLGA
jgi:hypothetical protein